MEDYKQCLINIENKLKHKIEYICFSIYDVQLTEDIRNQMLDEIYVSKHYMIENSIRMINYYINKKYISKENMIDVLTMLHLNFPIDKYIFNYLNELNNE